MNNQPDGQLIECPVCNRLGKKQILGRVLTNGDLLVLRFHHGTTIIRNTEYQLVCGCGFVFDISGTLVSYGVPAVN